MDILDKVLADILPLIDTDSIAQGIRELAQIEEKTDFDSFSASANYMHRRFSSIGMESKILGFPADGKTRYQCWTAPIGFRTTRAVCSIVEPAECARVLGDRVIEPNTAIVGTGYTGPGGIEAEVVHLKEPADALTADIQGKIVYCSRFGAPSVRQAVIERQGKAIVSSFTKHREENYGYVHWVNTWDAQTDGWLPTARAQEENLPGISLSPAMGDTLETCLTQGPVRLSIITEGEYFESDLLGVAATVGGQEDGLVLLTGHLFEQGLTDNAAGAIIGLSVSEIIQDLKKRPAAVRLRRGLLNFHSQECYGVMALSQTHPEIPARAFAHLNIDMIGVAEPPVGLLPGLLASVGLSGFLLRLILERAREHVPACRYEMGKKLDINCTLLADPLLGGVPTTQLEQLNPMWHTSHDRDGVQELDRDTIRFITLASATWAYFLVTAGDEEAGWLLGEYKKDVESALSSEDITDTQIYFELKQREMSSIAALVSPTQRTCFLDKVHEFAASAKARVKAQTAIVPSGNEQEIAVSKRLFPKALFGGPAVAACFTKEQLEDIGSPKWSSEQLVLKSWADGTRSIYDITRLGIFETGTQFTLGYTLLFFEHYAKQGIVSL